MSRFVALLRAVNVGGSGVMKMSELVALFESFGYDDVSTYIQSGNVLFSTKDSDPAKVERALAKKMKTAALVRSRAQLEDAAAHNPFEPAKNDKMQKTHLHFLENEPGAAGVEKLMAQARDQYRFHVRGRVLYYAYSSSLAGKRRMLDFDKLLGVTGTSRTWKVVDKLIELLAE